MRQLGLFGAVVRPDGVRMFRLGPIPAMNGVPAMPECEVPESELRRSCWHARRYAVGEDDWWVEHFCGPLDAAGVRR